MVAKRNLEHNSWPDLAVRALLRVDKAPANKMRVVGLHAGTYARECLRERVSVRAVIVPLVSGHTTPAVGEASLDLLRSQHSEKTKGDLRPKASDLRPMDLHGCRHLKRAEQHRLSKPAIMPKTKPGRPLNHTFIQACARAVANARTHLRSLPSCLSSVALHPRMLTTSQISRCSPVKRGTRSSCV